MVKYFSKTDRVIIVVIVDDGARREYLLETVHVCLVITLLPTIKLVWSVCGKVR